MDLHKMINYMTHENKQYPKLDDIIEEDNTYNIQNDDQIDPSYNIANLETYFIVVEYDEG